MVNLNKIKILAKEKGWSLSFLCEKLEISKSYFTDVKNGKTVISDDRLCEIASLLNTSTEYLTDKTDKKENPPQSFSPETIKLMERISKLTPEQIAQVIQYTDFVASQNEKK